MIQLHYAPGEDAFARLSTGVKMLIILVAALLPLGLIALFASVESASTNLQNGRDQASRHRQRRKSQRGYRADSLDLTRGGHRAWG